MDGAGFVVMAEEFGKQGEGRRTIGAYPSAAAAVEAAQGQVDAGLREAMSTGMSAHALLRAWTLFGEDIYILPPDARLPFSALDYARLRCVQLTGDLLRSVVFEVLCDDRLNTASGAPSAPGQWTFWVHAPATFASAGHAIRPAIDALYRDMSTRALDSDGSSYTLLAARVRELDGDQAAGTPWVGHPRFILQGDGTLQRME